MKTALSLFGLALLGLVNVSAQETPAPALAPLPANGAVTLTQIVSDFRTNPQAADQKYGGNRITVTGRVGRVETGGDGVDLLAVYLQEYENPTPDVKAFFPQDMFPPSSSVEISADNSQAIVLHNNHRGVLTMETPFAVVGQQIGIEGTYEHMQAGNIVLKDSRKLRQRELDALSGGAE